MQNVRLLQLIAKRCRGSVYQLELTTVLLNQQYIIFTLCHTLTEVDTIQLDPKLMILTVGHLQRVQLTI